MMTTTTKDLREENEEFNFKISEPFYCQVVWANSDKIPLVIERPASGIDIGLENCWTAKVHEVSLNGQAFWLLEYYYKLPLIRIPGSYCWYSDHLQYNLKDIVQQNFGDCYLPEIYMDGQLLPYKRGLEEFDIEKGIIRFRNEDFIKDHLGAKFEISFYKYIGQKGLQGLSDLPLNDDKPLLKSNVDKNATAQLKVYGKSENTKYALTKGGTVYMDGVSSDTEVILLKSSLQQAADDVGFSIDCGRWD